MLRRMLPLLLAMVLLSGCANPAGLRGETLPEDPVTLVYYTIGTPDADLKLVNQALNDILLPRYGFRVEYNKIGWNDYTDQLNALMRTGEDYDIAFTWTDLYVRNAQSGYLLDMTDYLRTDGQKLYDAVDPRFWEGVTVRDRIWGIPTNKELTSPIQFLFSKELVEKYQIDVSRYTTLESLEPLLELISQKEPDCIPLFFDTSRLNLMNMGDYTYLTSETVPLVVKNDDPSCTVVNLFDTPYAKQMLRTLHKYYKLGYINQDAPIRTAVSRFTDEQVFCRISSGGPDSEASFSTDFGYPIVAVQASNAVVTSDSTQGGVMVVNASTKHPEESKAFLTAVNTDPDVRNLLKFGIEGVHYTLTDQDQVQIISDAYRGVPYTQGNWFILKTCVGEDPNKWDNYRAFNAQAVSSPLLGFNADYYVCETLYSNVSQIYAKYYVALMTGSVDPDAYLEQLGDELDKAGIQSLCAIMQNQVDSWLANKAAQANPESKEQN